MHKLRERSFLPPGIPERHDPVEDRLSGYGIKRVRMEIALALELAPRLAVNPEQAGLQFGSRENLHRLRIEELPVIGSAPVGIGIGKEPVEKAHLGLDCMCGGNPVNRALDLAAIGRRTATR